MIRRVIVFAGLLAIGCAPMSQEVVAQREVCRDWLLDMRIGERPEMGSAGWGAALRDCTRRRLSAAGRIAVAIDEAAR